MRDLCHAIAYTDSLVEILDWPLPPREEGGPAGHRGILLDVKIEAESLKEAVALGAGAAFSTCDLLSVAHAVAIADPEPILVFGEESGLNGLRMGQFFQGLPWQRGPRRKFRTDNLEVLVQALAIHAGGSRSRRRIKRCLRMVRRSLHESDPNDRFEDLWQALESLNPLLQERFDLQTWFPGSPCKHCGHETQVKGASSGIRHALTDLMGLSSEEWRDLNNTRQDIVHAREEPEEIKRLAGERSNQLLQACFHALTSLVELPAEDMSRFLRGGLSLPKPARFFASACLAGFSMEDLEHSPAYPYFKVSYSAADLEEGDSDQYIERVKVNLNIQNFDGQVLELEIKGKTETDPEDPTARLTLSWGGS